MPFWLKQSKITSWCNNLSFSYKIVTLFLLLATSSFLVYFFLIQSLIFDIHNKKSHVKKNQEACCLIDKINYRFGVAMEKHKQLTFMFKKIRPTLPSLENTIRMVLDIAQKNAVTCYSVSPHSEKSGPLVSQYKIILKGSCEFHCFLSFMHELSQKITSITTPSLYLTKNKKNSVSFTLWVGAFNVNIMDT
jgi:hypothetical protein